LHDADPNCTSKAHIAGAQADQVSLELNFQALGATVSGATK
jgi:hypothetical protein